MKYFEVEFMIETPQAVLDDVRDVLAAVVGEAGFESFEETAQGLKGYVQQTLFDRALLDESLSSFPFADAHITYHVNEAEDRDWNEQWEQEGFEPIVVGERCIIHDGRHFGTLPGGAADLERFDIAIEIDAHLAFGTGTHETTRMMVGHLLSLPLTGTRVLDCGCGTGILGIAALKGGAEECVAYDIDEWSADNARHNAVINGVDHRFTSLLGDASLLATVEGSFDVVLANINRNVLLADMPAFRTKLAPRGLLLLSGFYQQDVAMLVQKAQSLGLELQHQASDGEWTLLAFKRTLFL